MNTKTRLSDRPVPAAVGLLILAGLLTACVVTADPPPVSSLQSPASSLQPSPTPIPITPAGTPLEERLFGVGARPHQWLVYTDIDVCDVNRSRVTWWNEHGVGEMVLWGDDLCVGGATPSVDGEQVRYEYKPELRDRIREAMQLARDANVRVIGYMHDQAWRGAYWKAHRTYDGLGVSIVREVQRQGWDGVVFDGGHLGRNRTETLWVLKRLKSLGKSITLHRSIEPYAVTGAGYLDVELVSLCDYTMWGETNTPGPQSLDDPVWEEQVSMAWLGSPTIGTFKPNRRDQDDAACNGMGKYWNDNRKWQADLPKRRCVARATRWRLEERGDWLKYYWPAYKAARDAYGRGLQESIR
ncbi:MAG TPA: hypothetical protein VMY37_07615 [Thermoguttaceae bacterium]|nr:hypothetical protein [Thermoguttaceae bacterium]